MTRRALQILSGGQAGVDRAALDAALALGVPCGGWCPAGRMAEDGVIDLRYPMRETESTGTEARTRRNVEEADATLVLDFGQYSPGTRLTVDHATRLEKPLLVIEAPRYSLGDMVDKIVRFVECCAVGSLNVAGPRASESPEAYLQARRVIEQVLRTLGIAEG